MIGPLLMRNLAKGLRLLLPFLLIICMYVGIVVYMFDPALAETLQAYQDSMPSMMSAFGMVGTATDLLSFMHIYLYGFLYLLVPLIFSMMLINNLLARDIDSGAIAQLLATPHRRAHMVQTHIVTIFLCVTLFFVFSTIFGYIAAEWFFPGELNLMPYLALNGAALLLQLALSGICFFAACISRNSRIYWLIGAGLPLLFYLVHMLVQMGGDTENLQAFTIFSLFPGQAIVDGGDMMAIAPSLGVLAGLTILLYALGAVVFCRRSFSV